MGNVLIIKDADFSANKVETIPLVDVHTYTNEDYLYTSLELQIANASAVKFSTSSNYYGGFVDVRAFRGSSLKYTNGAKLTYFAFIKDVTFANNGPFSFCTGTTLETVTANGEYNATIPADADYVYAMFHNTADSITSVVITVQR